MTIKTGKLEVDGKRVEYVLRVFDLVAIESVKVDALPEFTMADSSYSSIEDALSAISSYVRTTIR